MMIRSSIWLSTTLCAVYGHSLSFLWTSNIASVATSPHIGVAQYAVSIGMQLVATALDVAFIVSLGDNFLPDGVSSVSDPRFIESWQNVYISSGPHRALNVPWFVIAGVADYYGNVTAEIEFSNISEYWDFPDLYYAKSFNLSNCSMDMIFIDTTNLTLTEPNASNVQLEWIEEMLSNSTADYLVVLGNLPVFSVCESGNSPFLVERLHPLLRRHGAVYMSGHDQCAEHIVKDTVHYFVNGVGGGLGGRAVNIHNVFVDQLLFLLSESHVVSTSSNAYNETYGVFGSVEVFCGAMTVSFFTQSGHRMYSSHISSRYYFNDDNSTYIGTEEPSADPTVFSPPTVEPTALSTFEPTIIDIATASPTLKPTIEATKTSSPTFLFEPTAFPTFSLPTAEPTVSLAPTFQPLPTAAPTPTFSPTISKIPTAFPSPKPTVEPLPTFQPTVTVAPTISLSPTRGTPSLTPTIGVTNEPSFEPTPVIHITAVPTTAMPTYYHPPTFTPTYTFKPTLQHIPTYEPSVSLAPTKTSTPTHEPSAPPSPKPTLNHDTHPTFKPSMPPTPVPPLTRFPSPQPSFEPTFKPSSIPTTHPSTEPTPKPSFRPTPEPTRPTFFPTPIPSTKPSPAPTNDPTHHKPTHFPTIKPSTLQPTLFLDSNPTFRPSISPTHPTYVPSLAPTPVPPLTRFPSPQPSFEPTFKPSSIPTTRPTAEPTPNPSAKPTCEPTRPTFYPTPIPSPKPSPAPTNDPTHHKPTHFPTPIPSSAPSPKPSHEPTLKPSMKPLHRKLFDVQKNKQSAEPTHEPTHSPTTIYERVSHFPTRPSPKPTYFPTYTHWPTRPSPKPTFFPTHTHWPTQPSPAPTPFPTVFINWTEVSAAVTDVVCNPSNVSFLILSDWGGQSMAPYVTLPQTGASVGLSIVADIVVPMAIISLGDNFVSDGVTTSDSFRFSDTWSSAYRMGSLQVPWFLIAGESDYLGDVNLQIEYTSHSKNWNFPALYYAMAYSSCDGNVTVDIVYIDTISLTGVIDTVQNVTSELLANATVVDEEQLVWIENTLKESTADYIFVVGHYPILSACSSGGTPALLSALHPLFVKYGAHYFAGHDHCMEHIIYDSVNYYVNGLGRGGFYPASNIASLPKHAKLAYVLAEESDDGDDIFDVNIGINGTGTNAGFTGLVAYSDHATVSYYNQYGDVLYTSDCHSNSTSSVIVDTNSESDSGSSLLGGGAIAGIVIGVMIAVGLALFGAYYVTMKQKQSDLQESLIETGPSSYGQK